MGSSRVESERAGSSANKPALVECHRGAGDRPHGTDHRDSQRRRGGDRRRTNQFSIRLDSVDLRAPAFASTEAGLALKFRHERWRLRPLRAAAILLIMRSQVAEQLRQEQREQIRRMTPSQRVALALALGEPGLRIYMAGQRTDRASAARAIRKSRQIGRRYSRCMDDSLK